MNDLQKKLFTAYDSEYQSILESIRKLLAEVESTGQPLSAPSLNEAFRMAHTLKGSSHVVGFPTIVVLAHRLESLFAKVRDGLVKLEINEIRAIYSVLDTVEDIVQAFKAGADLPDTKNVLTNLENILGMSAAPAEKSVAAPKPAAPILKAVPPPPSAPPPAPKAPVIESDSVRLSASHLDQLLGTAGELLSVIRGSRQVDAKIANVGGHLSTLR